MEDMEKYIEKHKSLFWSVGEKRKKDISKSLLVETILNYGTLEDCRELIAVLGLKETANIFFQNTQNKPRHNYYPEVENYFRHYFQRHAQ
jgi:hypothetical protein